MLSRHGSWIKSCSNDEKAQAEGTYVEILHRKFQNMWSYYPTAAFAKSD